MRIQLTDVIPAHAGIQFALCFCDPGCAWIEWSL